MQKPPKISVIIPTFNRLHTLPRAIESVLTQTERDFELIVIDEASTDGTQDYLSRLADPRIRTIGRDPSTGAPRKLGVSGARNLGLAAARADIVGFLDSDDVYRPRRLAVTLSAFAGDPEIVCTIVSAVTQVRGRLEEVRLPDLKLPSAVFKWALYSDLFPLATTAITMRREVALAIGGFNTALSYGEDREILIRIAALGAVRLISDILWQKFWSLDGLSMQWANAGRGLIAFLRERPEYRSRYPKIASYLVTQILVSDVRHRLWSALLRDLREFGAEGLLTGKPVQLWRNHREVRRYRHGMRRSGSLALIVDPPKSWH
jgi:glycosyltransferase involved in cell wall biosynthesis